MTKHLQTLAFLLLAIFALPSCGGDEDDKDPEGKDPEEDIATGLTVKGADWQFNSCNFYGHVDREDDISFEACGTVSDSLNITFYWHSTYTDAEAGEVTPEHKIFNVSIKPAKYGVSATYRAVSGSITTSQGLKNEDRAIVKFNHLNLRLTDGFYPPSHPYELVPNTVSLTGSIDFVYDGEW